MIILLDRHGANSVLMIADHLNETLSKVESLIDSDLYSGSLDDIYDVIETFSIYRPVRCFKDIFSKYCTILINIFNQESSVNNLMAYRKEFLVPTEYQWIDNLKMFLNHFYTKENRTLIRIQAVNRTMKEVYQQNRLV